MCLMFSCFVVSIKASGLRIYMVVHSNRDLPQYPIALSAFLFPATLPVALALTVRRHVLHAACAVAVRHVSIVAVNMEG